ncbi:MAG: hypothetical protein RLZZ371_446 [Pseudomonadota bacterium]
MKHARKPPIWLVALIAISGTIGMHMFLPALPYAARDLATGSGQMQMTISVYIVGLAIGQLIYGPLSDALGRRPVLMAGLALYVLASIAAALAPNVTVLLCVRVLQSLGGCAGVAIARAILRDTNTAEGTARSMGMLAMLMTFSPVLAPMVGGGVTAAFGWRGNFMALGLLGAITLGLVFIRLEETARPSGRFEMAAALRDYRELLCTRHYVSFAVGGGFLTTSMFAFLTAAPFILTQELKQSVQLAGIYSGLVLVGAAIGNGVGSFLSRRVRSERLLRGGLMLSLLASAVFLVLVLTHSLSLTALIGHAIGRLFLKGIHPNNGDAFSGGR